MFQPKPTAVFIAILAVILPAASFLLPVPSTDTWLSYHAFLAFTLAVTVEFIGAAVLFFKGLTGFTNRLKRAYACICISLALLGLAYLQLPLVVYSGQVEKFWRDGGFTALPFMIGLIMLFIGMRAFARLFAIKHASLSVWFVLTGVVVLAAVSAVLPHAPTTTPETKFDASTAFTIVNMFIIGLAACHAWLVKQKAGVTFTPALAWLFLGFATMSIAGVAYAIAVLSLGDQQWYLVGVTPLIPSFVGGIFLIKAASAFNRITASGDTQVAWVARNFFGTPVEPQSYAGREATSVDIVVYAANLASNLQDIQAPLDRLRRLTAGLKPGQPLSPAQEATLKEIFLQLEEYLLQHEAVRKFTKDTLRQQIADQLHLTVGAHYNNFWQSLT